MLENLTLRGSRLIPGSTSNGNAVGRLCPGHAKTPIHCAWAHRTLPDCLLARIPIIEDGASLLEENSKMLKEIMRRETMLLLCAGAMSEDWRLRGSGRTPASRQQWICRQVVDYTLHGCRIFRSYRSWRLQVCSGRNALID